MKHFGSILERLLAHIEWIDYKGFYGFYVPHANPDYVILNFISDFRRIQLQLD
jgi:hypothetical protein